MTKFHCRAIKHNIRLETDSKNNTRISPCCVYKNKQLFTSITDYYGSQDYHDLVTAQDWPAACQVCEQTEAQGLTSYRNYFDLKPHTNTGISFEIMPSNICNLRCIMCSSDSSSALAKERFDIKLDAVNHSRETNQTIEQLEILKQFDNIESISVIGGEFFLTKGNLEIMDFVKEHNIPFRVVTNATVLLDSHLQRLKSLAQLDLQISIDGVGSGYEFVRYPGKWHKFDHNTKLLIENLPNAKINFHFVAQTQNIFQLVPTLDYTNRFRKHTRITGLVKPEYLGWQILTAEEKQSTVDTVLDQINHFKITQTQKQQVKQIAQAILSSNHVPSLRQQFLDTVPRFYKNRKLSRSDLDQHLGVLQTLIE